MSLGIISGVDAASYWEATTHIHPLATAVVTFPSLTIGVTEPRGDSIYYDRLDRVIGTVLTDGAPSMRFWDPLLLDASSSGAGFVSFVNAAGAPTNQCIGEWNKDTNVQRFYSQIIQGVGTNREWIERDPITMGTLDADPYPNIGTIETRASGITNVDSGYWESNANNMASPASNDDGGQIIFFETLGKAYKTCSRARLTGSQFGGGLLGGCFIEIDLVTGLTTDILDLPCVYQNTPSDWQAPPFGGDEFNLTKMQFVPDIDSTVTAPKGRLVLHSIDVTGLLANEQFVYFAIHDFNPQGVVGGAPNRVHLRQRLLSRIAYFDSTAITTLGGIGVTATATLNSVPWIFHPPTNTLRTYAANLSGIGTDLNITADKVVALTYSASADVSDITKPTELGRVLTNSRTDFSSDVIGDLNEKIAGVGVDFTLRRVSTLDDNLGTSTGSEGAVAGDFALTHTPLDSIDEVIKITAGPNGDQSLDTEYTAIAVGAAAAGNEVEVNVNGDLQFFVATVATDLASGDIVLATYLHLDVPVTPAHGTLLNASGRSDEDGQAFTQVEYPDNDRLENLFDRLDADQVV